MQAKVQGAMLENQNDLCQWHGHSILSRKPSKGYRCEQVKEKIKI